MREMTLRESRPLKVYRRCTCSAKHRTYRTLARCCWPGHVWIVGEGPFATVSYCQNRGVRYRTITVMLHPTEVQAREALAQIDTGGCGGGCVGNHALVRLVLPEP